MIKEFIKNNILLFLLLLTALYSRLIYLNLIPAAVSNDELHYILNARSFYLTGRDIFNSLNIIDIFLFKFPSYETVQAELNYLIDYVTLGPFGFSLLGVSLVNAILGILSVILIYKITKILLNKEAALFACMIAVINPWMIFISRSGYEAGLAIPLFLGILYFSLVLKSWKILYVIPIGLLAFYSYIGTKIIFLPFLLCCILYAYFFVNKRKYFKQYLFTFLFFLILVLFFIFQFNSQSLNRSSEIITPNSDLILNQLKSATNIFENKYSIFISTIIKNAVNVLSPKYLFEQGDFFFLKGTHGLFYFPDLIFLIAGLLYLIIKNKKLTVLFFVLILLSISPQVIHREAFFDKNFSPHITLLVPFYVITIGIGLYSIFKFLNFRIVKFAFVSIIIIAYGFMFKEYFNNFIRFFPQQENVLPLHNRILAKYLTFALQRNVPVVILAQDEKLAFKEFIFYTDIYNKENILNINNAIVNNNLRYKNIAFQSCNNSLEVPKDTILIDDYICGRGVSNNALNIVQLADSGTRYRIYNDNEICKKYSNSRFMSFLSKEEYEIEKYNLSNFCNKFIIKF